MAWPSLGSFREKPTSRCRKSLSSYTLTNTVHHRQDRLITISVMLLSLPPFLLLISNMRVRACSLGQQILSESMSIKKYICKLTLKTEDSHLRASTNARRPQENANLITWEALGKLSISRLCEKYRERAPVSWYLTESMAASRKNGGVITNKRRPHPIASISLSNFYAVILILFN